MNSEELNQEPTKSLIGSNQKVWIGVGIIILIGLLVGAYFLFIKDDAVDSGTNAVVNDDSSNQTYNEEWEHYQYFGNYHKFSADVPKDWVRSEKIDQGEENMPFVSATDFKSKTGNFFMVKFFNNTYDSLGEWVAAHKIELLKSNETIIEEVSKDDDFSKIIVITEMKDTFNYMHCYIGGVGVVYEIYSFSEISNWSGYSKIYEKVCSSFRL